MAGSLGNVYLIGAGPGDPGLLILRGRDLLARADVILYDYLASPRLLDHCRPDAEKICLGQHGRGKLWTQDEINARLIADARAGRNVARLKGGDPAVFGRLAEELSALITAHIPHEIVPGVSAATAVASYAGLSLTDREAASCVTFLTGQECGGKLEGLDFSAIAKLPGTLVVYMGATTAPLWSEQLIRHGKSPDTPVAVVRRASLPDQQTWQCTLAEVPRLLGPGKIRPPVLAIIGEVASRPPSDNWFATRPLFGQTILVTRPEGQAGSFAAQLAELGARVLVQPAITIAPPANWQAVDAMIDRLDEFDWLVFSSRNGVEFFLNRLYERGLDARTLRNVKLAAIGPATVAALAEYHLHADLAPTEYRAETLAEALSHYAEQGRRFLLLRASRGREVLAEMLSAARGIVEQVVVYESNDVATACPEIASALQAEKIDWVTVTSSAIARSLVRLFGEDLRQTKLLAISPLTADVLRELGFPPAIVANSYTTAGIIDALTSQTARM